MTPFTLDLDGSRLLLTLSGEITIEHAQALTEALRARLTHEITLAVDATRLARFDAAILQVLLAAAQKAGDTQLAASSPAWAAAFSRYASPDPFGTN